MSNRHDSRRGYALVTPPSVSPIALAMAKKHLRVEHDLEDDLIGLYLEAVVDAVEGYTRRALMEQTSRLDLDAFPRYGDPICVAIPPFVSVTSVKYVDEAGVEQTLSGADYAATFDQHSARIFMNPTLSWPTTISGRPSVASVTFKHGYTTKEGDPDKKIPAAIKSAMLLWLGHLYEHRESVNVGNIVTEMPHGVEALLSKHRAVEF